MTEQNAQLARIAFQRADGTTGVLDIHDEHAIPDEPDAIDSENLASGAVVNGKVAPDAITEVELADGAVTKDKLSPEMQEAWDSQSQCPFPIGALYLSFDSVDPVALWPGTTWQQQTGRFIRMANDVNIGGSDTVTLTVNQIPSHTHKIVSDTYYSAQGDSPRSYLGPNLNRNTTTYTEAAGGGQPHNNMPAYQDVYAWRRLN